MAKPYSLDLRERVVVRVLAGEPVRLVARRFGVSASSVVKWSQRFRATGSAAAGKMGGWLLDRIVRADFTLRGLVAELAERGVKVDYRTVWSFVHAERLSFKKNRRSQRAGRTSPIRESQNRFSQISSRSSDRKPGRPSWCRPLAQGRTRYCPSLAPRGRV
jgi:putative transposase